MNEFSSTVQNLLLYTTNGTLATLYLAWEHGTALVTLACFLWFLRAAPEGQRAWMAGAGGLAVVAALFAPAPVPVLLTAMTGVGAGAVALDRFQPAALVHFEIAPAEAGASVRVPPGIDGTYAVR